MDAKEHWEHIWRIRKPDEVSWYQKSPKASIDLILSLIPKNAKIIDVGGGASNLAGELLDARFEDITVLDISVRSIQSAKERLGKIGEKIKWINCDIREFMGDEQYSVWHDRALFHFLTSYEDITKYTKIVKNHLKKEGLFIVGTFSKKGPNMCSGLETVRYSEESIKKTFSDGFEHIQSFEEEHLTPQNKKQYFIWSVFRSK